MLMWEVLLEEGKFGLLVFENWALGTVRLDL